jgi:hypothetical protein
MDAKGVAVLSPLRVHYETPDFRLPVRLGLLNSPSGPPGSASATAKQDLIVWTLSKASRYEVANYKNVFIPTNVDVKDETRSAFGPFYANLFDATLEKAGGRAIVTEYSWTSSGCDPCPTPPMTDNDVASLGGDALLGMKALAPDSAGAAGDTTGGYYGGTTQAMVLTRLHARYDAATLTDDLVFKVAEPVVGGREFLTMQTSGKNVQLETGAKPSAYNQFQARYAIRHAWQGEIKCEKPRRGVWGGPPHGGHAGPVPAMNLASAARDVQYATYVKSSVEELAVQGPPAGAAPDGTFPTFEAPATIYRKREKKPDWGSFLLGFVGAGIVLLGVAMATSKKP